MRAVYLICYDIADPKRLRKVHKTTEDHGPRLQYSVYQCELSKMALIGLKEDLAAIINHRQDQVLFVHLGPEKDGTFKRIESLGRAYVPPEGRSYVV
jgi:CRISPR-associated protein Cas2